MWESFQPQFIKHPVRFERGTLFGICYGYQFFQVYKLAPNSFASANLAGVLFVELSAVTIPLSSIPI